MISIKKIFIEIMNEKIRLLNHSQKIYVIIKNIFNEIMNKKSVCEITVKVLINNL